MDYKTKKLLWNILYFVMGGVSLLMTFVTFYRIKGPSFYGYSTLDLKFSDFKWLKLCLNPTGDLEKILQWDYDFQDLMFDLPAVPGYIKIISILIFAIPIIMVVVGIVMQALSMKKNRWNAVYAVFPGIAAVFSVVGWIVSNVLLKKAMGQLFEIFGDVGEEEIAGAIGNVVKLSPGIGLILFAVLNIAAAVVAAVLLPGLNGGAPYRKRAYSPRQPEFPGSAYRPEPVQNGAPPIQPAPPVRPTKPETAYRPEPEGYKNKEIGIRCLRGQYQGAQIAMKPGETIYLGRDNKVCQLVFDDPHISRKHCSISYSASEDKYILTNHSKNGMQLDDGTELRVDIPMKISRETAFRINEDNVFKPL